MARRAGPWYRASRGMWFATINGHQICLEIRGEENEAAAQEKFNLLVRAALQAPPLANPATPAPPVALPRTVEKAATEFLAKRKPKISAGCWRQYDITLRVHFLPVFGERVLTELTAEEIEEWADRPEWSSSTRNNNLGTIQTFLKWAKHPLPIRRPPKESRGADAVLSDEQFAKVLAAASSGDYGSDLAAFLKLLRETGARPQEIATLTADSVDWENRCARLKHHKTRHHGHERVIHFSSEAMSILESQRAKYRSGWLLRTRNGNPWRPAQIVKRMVQVSERAGVHATAYMGRHSFATRALANGVPDAVVAELLGHRGTAMVAKHYGHLSGQAKVLKDALERLGRREAG